MLINLKRIAYYIKNDPQHLSLSHVRPKILKELQAVKEYIENLEALICQVCCDEQEDEDYVGCCQDGNCSHVLSIFVNIAENGMKKRNNGSVLLV